MMVGSATARSVDAVVLHGGGGFMRSASLVSLILFGELFGPARGSDSNETVEDLAVVSIGLQSSIAAGVL